MAYLVLFEAAGQTLALPAEALHKVVDPVRVTPLPFVTGPVEGLVSAGGAIVIGLGLVVTVHRPFKLHPRGRRASRGWLTSPRGDAR